MAKRTSKNKKTTKKTTTKSADSKKVVQSKTVAADELKTQKAKAVTTKKTVTKAKGGATKSAAQAQAEMDAKMGKKNDKEVAFFDNEVNRIRVYAVLFGILFIALTIGFSFFVVEDWVKGTDDYKLAQERIEQEEADKEAEEAREELTAERDALIAQENETLIFQDRSVTMATNFGDLVIDLKYDAAPANVENFVRLVNRGFYTDQTIHRVVEQPSFAVIQGGQAGEDQLAEAALGGTVIDELWEVAPQVESTESGNNLLNEPVLRDPELTRDLDITLASELNPNGTITYPKGLILMAKTNEPDSATTQFFVTTQDTVLPAVYTPFGVVRADNFATLDAIFDGVEVIPTGQTEGDGVPSEEIRYTITLN